MKVNLRIGLIASAAALLLSGCVAGGRTESAAGSSVNSYGNSQTSGGSDNSSAISGADSQSGSSSESSSTSSAIIPPASSSSKIPSSSASKPPISSTVPEKKPIIVSNADTVIEEGDVYVVNSGETLHVSSGKIMLVNGRLLCSNGGKIFVDEGGGLMVNGEIELSGELELRRGGELALSVDAKLYGEGAASISSFNDINCEGDFTARIIPPAPVVTDGVTTVGDVLIVNKKYSLPETFGREVVPDAMAALETMRSSSGYKMPIVLGGGYRSYEYQKQVFEKWCRIDGEEVASTYSARPGHSEHQSGLAIDITSLSQSYGQTAEGKWVAENCHKYGFILRYPKGKDNITGYMYEPWHMRWLGKSTAKLVHDSGLTLEEFLGVEG